LEKKGVLITEKEYAEYMDYKDALGSKYDKLIENRIATWQKFFKSIPKRKLSKIKLIIKIPCMSKEQVYALAETVGRSIRNRENIKVEAY
jgi:hypothetical protein